MPQGSKLGPLLYILYANDLVEIFKYAKVKMYADDLTIYAVVNNESDKHKLQNELNELCEWADKWQLSINFNKCSVLHFGYNNNNFTYKLKELEVKTCQSEKILGVTIDSDLTFHEHIYQCVNKASRMNNLILMNMKYVDIATLINLYKCFSRPLLEYACVIFSPHHKYLIDVIENVQRRFTKRLPGLFNKNYRDRLKICELELLETRRICTDVALMYKILNGYVCIELNDCVCISDSVNTRGNNCKLSKFGARVDVRKYFFAYRCINVWNYIPAYIVNCKSLNNFMKKLSSVDFSIFLKGRAYE